MKGFKTILVGLHIAIVPAITQYVGAINWDAFLPAPYSTMVAGAIMILMRFFTTTPVASGSQK